MTFTDPLVADTELIRDAIHSSNYVTGVSGWSINRSGSAEFRDVTVANASGNVTIDSNGLTVTDPDGSYVQIYDDNPGVGANVVINPADMLGHAVGNSAFTTYTDDTAGIESVTTEIRGPAIDTSDAARIEMWGGGTVNNAATLIAVANDINLSVSEPTAGPGLYDGRIAINATEGRIHHSENVTVDSDSTVALDGGDNVTLTASNDVTVTANGGIITLDPATQTNSEAEIYKSSGGTAEGWNTLTLLNTWANRGAGYPQLAYRRVASPPNSLQLIGVCAGGAGAYGGGTIIAQLPAGYRPAVSTSFPVGGAVASDATSTPTIQVDTSGNLRVWYHAFGRYTEFAVTIPLDAS